MKEYYKIIQDEQMLLNFIQWLPELTSDEVYLVTLFARKKYYSDQTGIKADKNQLARFTANKDWLYRKIKRLEIEVNGYNFDDKPIPQEALALYITINPRSQKKAGVALLKELATTLTDSNQVGYNVHKMALNATQKACSRKVFMDFDVDGQDLESTWLQLDGRINKDCVHVLKTRGGFHLLIETNKIAKEFEKTWYNNLTKLPGVDVSNADLQPVPGCTQGSYIPYLMLKEELPE